MRDRETGRSRGFGFVTYSTSQEAEAAIAGLHEQELDGRRIKVNLANARGGGGGGGGGGGWSFLLLMNILAHRSQATAVEVAEATKVVEATKVAEATRVVEATRVEATKVAEVVATAEDINKVAMVCLSRVHVQYLTFFAGGGGY